MTEPIIKVTPEEWDAQYRAGSWDYLREATAHYGVIGALVRRHRCTSILDVGCGTGEIIPFLPDYLAYLGIDCSEVAATRASHQWSGNHNIGFLLRDSSAEAFNADCAIFCESLYYMPDPLEVLARYFQFCKIIFLSIMISDKTAALIRSIDQRFNVVDDFQLQCSTGGGWEIMAVKP